MDLMLDAIVSVLIDEDRGCWSEEIITSLFSLIDDSTILDTFVWHYSKNGIFSI
ncbi:hypothetical protein CsSME_00025288 [Camellia sinensis var. sinensis]